MKHFKLFGLLMAICLSFFVTPIASALDVGPVTPRYEAAYKLYDFSKSIETNPIFQAPALPPPPTTYNVEAIYDRDSKGVAVGASAFWKRLTHKDKYVDINFFGGLDKRQVPLAALLVKATWSPADQISLSFGPAIEWKQSKLLGLSLFAGISIK